MANQTENRSLRNFRRWGVAWGVIHGLLAIPVLILVLALYPREFIEVTVVVVREADAPMGEVRALVGGWPLTPRLAGVAGIEFHPEMRHQWEVGLRVTMDGAPIAPLERRLRARSYDCQVVVRLTRDGFSASDCLLPYPLSS